MRWLAAMMLLLGAGWCAWGQAVPAATLHTTRLYAGVEASGFALQYGQRRMGGASVFLDADTTDHFGWTLEARDLFLRQTARVTNLTLMAGPRYRRVYGRFTPYAEGLAGVGFFRFPYQQGQGKFLVLGGAAGLDYRVNNRLRLRLADFELDDWQGFYLGSMKPQSIYSYGFSAGVRLRLH